MLVVFDIDGTLTRSSRLDDETYATAFASAFGVALPSIDWAEYASATDEGIAAEAVARLGLSPAGVPRFKAIYLAALRLWIEKSPIEPVPGARSIVTDLRRAGHAVALATGSWEEAARLKLASAGVSAAGCPLVGSDERPDRVRVIEEAIRRANATGRIVYVGDGAWDVVAAKALSLPFVGVDSERTGRLGALGVGCIAANYEDMPLFLAALEGATVPA